MLIYFSKRNLKLTKQIIYSKLNNFQKWLKFIIRIVNFHSQPRPAIDEINKTISLKNFSKIPSGIYKIIFQYFHEPQDFQNFYQFLIKNIPYTKDKLRSLPQKLTKYKLNYHKFYTETTGKLIIEYFDSQNQVFNCRSAIHQIFIFEINREHTLSAILYKNGKFELESTNPFEAEYEDFFPGRIPKTILKNINFVDEENDGIKQIREFGCIQILGQFLETLMKIFYCISQKNENLIVIFCGTKWVKFCHSHSLIFLLPKEDDEKNIKIPMAQKIVFRVEKNICAFLNI